MGDVILSIVSVFFIVVGFVSICVHGVLIFRFMKLRKLQKIHKDYAHISYLVVLNLLGLIGSVFIGVTELHWSLFWVLVVGTINFYGWDTMYSFWEYETLQTVGNLDRVFGNKEAFLLAYDFDSENVLGLDPIKMSMRDRKRVLEIGERFKRYVEIPEMLSTLESLSSKKKNGITSYIDLITKDRDTLYEELMNEREYLKDMFGLSNAYRGLGYSEREKVVLNKVEKMYRKDT